MRQLEVVGGAIHAIIVVKGVSFEVVSPKGLRLIAILQLGGIWIARYIKSKKLSLPIRIGHPFEQPSKK